MYMMYNVYTVGLEGERDTKCTDQTCGSQLYTYRPLKPYGTGLCITMSMAKWLVYQQIFLSVCSCPSVLQKS